MILKFGRKVAPKKKAKLLHMLMCEKNKTVLPENIGKDTDKIRESVYEFGNFFEQLRSGSQHNRTE